MEFLSLAVAWGVTVSAMYLFRPVAIEAGLVDHPGGRKFHDGVVPVIGGLAMFTGVVSGLLLLEHAALEFISLMVASTLLLVTGVVDDRFSMHALARIPVQIAAVLLMVYGGGFLLTDMGDPFGTGIITTGRFAFLFTLLVTIATINAYNYIDGVDGLAGSLALVALLSIAAVAGLANHFSAEALIFAAAICGFLLFNFPFSWNGRFRTFMGDAGSTLLGFSIVWIMIGVCQGPERVFSPVTGLWFAALPIFDFFTCFVKRILKRKSPFTPGRDHVHHILHRGGFSVRERLVILVGMQITYSSVGIAGYYFGAPDVVMFAAWSFAGLSQSSVLSFFAKHSRRKSIIQLKSAQGTLATESNSAL